MIYKELKVAIESGDQTSISKALGEAVTAYGGSKLAAETGLPRSTIYSVLTEGNSPKLSTLMAILNGLGYKLTTLKK